MRSDNVRDKGSCSIGVTSQTLPAWLAGGLNAQDSERVRVHVPTCEVCQGHLGAYSKKVA